MTKGSKELRGLHMVKYNEFDDTVKVFSTVIKRSQIEPSLLVQALQRVAEVTEWKWMEEK